jgi:hypothetical protein
MDKRELFLLGVAIFFITLLFNFLETWYFGWNLKPQSPAEMSCDYISTAGTWSGIFTVIYALIFKI